MWMIQQTENQAPAVGWDLRALWKQSWPQILFVIVVVIFALVLVSRRKSKGSS